MCAVPITSPGGRAGTVPTGPKATSPATVIRKTLAKATKAGGGKHDPWPSRRGRTWRPWYLGRNSATNRRSGCGKIGMKDRVIRIAGCKGVKSASKTGPLPGQAMNGRGSKAVRAQTRTG
eukprot:6814879-Pyramimonas_sp.AAC.1